jgi:hypothetical protein
VDESAVIGESGQVIAIGLLGLLKQAGFQVERAEREYAPRGSGIPYRFGMKPTDRHDGNGFRVTRSP